MAVSGNLARRQPYEPLLPEWGHVSPCFCHHCPLNRSFPECNLACADELDHLFPREDPRSAAAFIFEPVVGATLGAAVPPEGYARRIAEICRRHGMLLIADEIMTGMGRTGKPFAVEHWGIEPDIITVGKGVASGYAPLGAVIAGPRVVEAFERGSGTFQHGFTYQAHPVAMAAGNAVLDVLDVQQLFARVPQAAAGLMAALAPLRDDPNVGDIRGMGLLVGIEFVKDKARHEPFPRDRNVAEKIRKAAMELGVLTYPTQGCVDGLLGDHILLAPPFIITREECEVVAAAIGAALKKINLAAN
jgi:adenosylmethionine-8-amino-7-oxononanoate aminotransferase